MSATKSNVLPHVSSMLEQLSHPSDHVLEIGCGGAQYRMNAWASYVGVDLPSVAYPGEGPDVYANGETLPFDTSSFDLVFFVAVLHVIPNVDKALSEVLRVLAPNGRLIVFDYNLVTTSRLARLNALKQRKTHIWSARDLAARVQRAGFEPKIEWDYVRGRAPLFVFLQRFKLIRYLRFWFWQFSEDWVIVQGKKA